MAVFRVFVNKIIEDWRMNTKEKIKTLCEKYNITDVNEFIAFYLQYKNYYSVINLVKAYKKHIFIYNEFKH